MLQFWIRHMISVDIYYMLDIVVFYVRAIVTLFQQLHCFDFPVIGV